jgi:hypothetical protein
MTTPAAAMPCCCRSAANSGFCCKAQPTASRRVRRRAPDWGQAEGACAGEGRVSSRDHASQQRQQTLQRLAGRPFAGNCIMAPSADQDNRTGKRQKRVFGRVIPFASSFYRPFSQVILKIKRGSCRAATPAYRPPTVPPLSSTAAAQGGSGRRQRRRKRPVHRRGSAHQPLTAVVCTPEWSGLPDPVAVVRSDRGAPRPGRRSRSAPP